MGALGKVGKVGNIGGVGKIGGVGRAVMGAIAWDPNLHPRNEDGEFIESGMMVDLNVGDEMARVKVVGNTPDGDITVEGPDGEKRNVPSAGVKPVKKEAAIPDGIAAPKGAKPRNEKGDFTEAYTEMSDSELRAAAEKASNAAREAREAREARGDGDVAEENDLAKRWTAIMEIADGRGLLDDLWDWKESPEADAPADGAEAEAPAKPKRQKPERNENGLTADEQEWWDGLSDAERADWKDRLGEIGPGDIAFAYKKRDKPPRKREASSADVNTQAVDAAKRADRLSAGSASKPRTQADIDAARADVDKAIADSEAWLANNPDHPDAPTIEKNVANLRKRQDTLASLRGSDTPPADAPDVVEEVTPTRARRVRVGDTIRVPSEDGTEDLTVTDWGLALDGRVMLNTEDSRGVQMERAFRGGDLIDVVETPEPDAPEADAPDAGGWPDEAEQARLQENARMNAESMTDAQLRSVVDDAEARADAAKANNDRKREGEAHNELVGLMGVAMERGLIDMDGEWSMGDDTVDAPEADAPRVDVSSQSAPQTAAPDVDTRSIFTEGMSPEDAATRADVLATAGEPAEFSAINRKGTPEGTGTQEDPIAVGADLDRAILLLSEGKHVRLDQPEQVATLIDKLAAAARSGDPADYDLGLVSVPGTNLFAESNLGLDRIEMPQLTGNPEEGSIADRIPRNAWGEVDLSDGFVDTLASAGISVDDKKMPAANLRATQRELDGAKVAKLMEKMQAGEWHNDAAIFVTRDGYILDGHHRWAAQVAHDTRDGVMGDEQIDVRVVDLDVGAALDFANAYARHMGMPQRDRQGMTALNDNYTGSSDDLSQIQKVRGSYDNARSLPAARFDALAARVEAGMRTTDGELREDYAAELGHLRAIAPEGTLAHAEVQAIKAEAARAALDGDLVVISGVSDDGAAYAVQGRFVALPNGAVEFQDSGADYSYPLDMEGILNIGRDYVPEMPGQMALGDDAAPDPEKAAYTKKYDAYQAAAAAGDYDTMEVLAAEMLAAAPPGGFTGEGTRKDGEPFGSGYTQGDPRQDPAYDQYVEDLGARIAEAEAKFGDTRKHHVVRGADGEPVEVPDPSGDDGRKLVLYTKERRDVHHRMVEDFVADLEARGVPKDKQAVFLAGPSGAGKSTVIKKNGHEFGVESDANGNPTNFAVLNPDDVKAMMRQYGLIPDEYQSEFGLTDDEIAHLTHEESSDITKYLRDRLLNDGYNIIVDGTFAGKAEKKKREVITYRNAGYATTGVLVDGEVTRSFINAGRRHRKPPAEPGGRYGGRFVPYFTIEGQRPSGASTNRKDYPVRPHRSQNSENFEATMDVFDNGQAIYDNGSGPSVQVWTSIGPGQRVAESKAYRLAREIKEGRHLETKAGGADRNRGNAETLRRYWTRGPGGAKIAWGTDGDWTRCVALVSEHLGSRAKGYCNLRHKEMNGKYPGEKSLPTGNAQRIVIGLTSTLDGQVGLTLAMVDGPLDPDKMGRLVDTLADLAADQEDVTDPAVIPVLAQDVADAVDGMGLSVTAQPGDPIADTTYEFLTVDYGDDVYDFPLGEPAQEMIVDALGKPVDLGVEADDADFAEDKDEDGDDD